MEPSGLHRDRRAGIARGFRHGDAFLRGLHFRFAAGRHSGRQRANDAADHRNDVAAERRRQIHRRPLHIYLDVRAQRAEQDGARKSTSWSCWLATLLGILSFAAFFYLIDYASRLLRPISILAHVGSDGLAVIESVYPDPSLGPDIQDGESLDLGPPDRRHSGIRERRPLFWRPISDCSWPRPKRSDGIIEFVPQVGDFVAVDEPLFNLYGGAQSIDEDTLRASVAFGSERTMDQDPTFAFRIVVDIALKALSPAINDPTTAVLAIDQLHRMLRTVGKRHLRTDEILTNPDNCAWFSGRPTGRILCISHSARSAPAARTICRL